MSSRPARPRRALTLLLALAASALVASLASSQSRTTTSTRGSSRNDRNTLSRRTAGGGDFPTWEREVESDERSPLPTGRQGRHVPAWTHELGGASPGIAVAGGSVFVVPLEDGSIRLLGLDGDLVRVLLAEGRILLPPTRAGSLVLLAAGERVVAVDHEQVAWGSEPGGRIVRPIVAAWDAAYVAREGGSLEKLSLRDGRLLWRVSVGGEIASGPTASSQVVAVGLGGDVLGFAAADGQPAFRVPLGDRVDSVLLTETMLHAAGMGVSGRSRDVTPIMAGWPLRPRDGVPSDDPWRLRVGGACGGQASALDDFVVFSCADGYVRAIDRGKGVGGWKTDLPSATTAPPVLQGGRLDYFVPQSRHAVSIQADNGAVIGWLTLPDEDETFVGQSAGAGGLSVSATSFGRVVAWGWEWLEDAGSDESGEPRLRPGEDADDARSRGVPVAR